MFISSFFQENDSVNCSYIVQCISCQACFTAPSWCRGPPFPPGHWWMTRFTMLSRWPTVSTVPCQPIWWRTTKISSSVSGISHSQTLCLWMWKLRASWQQWGHLETVFLFPATLVHQASISGLLNSLLSPFLMLVFFWSIVCSNSAFYILFTSFMV